MTPEAKVTQDIIKWLKGLEWRCLRTHSITARGPSRGWFQVGEPGMADWLCMSYDLDQWLCPAGKGRMFWLETKAPGEAPTKVQREWIRKEENRGAVVIVADSLASFKKQFKAIYV